MRNFYIADCHFNHSSVLHFDHRPFADTQQMEEAMVMLWNAAVHWDDMKSSSSGNSIIRDSLD